MRPLLTRGCRSPFPCRAPLAGGCGGAVDLEPHGGRGSRARSTGWRRQGAKCMSCRCRRPPRSAGQFLKRTQHTLSHDGGQSRPSKHRMQVQHARRRVHHPPGFRRAAARRKVLAGEQAHGQRAVGQQADALLVAALRQPGVKGAAEQAVGVLEGGGAGEGGGAAGGCGRVGGWVLGGVWSGVTQQG